MLPKSNWKGTDFPQYYKASVPDCLPYSTGLNFNIFSKPSTKCAKCGTSCKNHQVMQHIPCLGMQLAIWQKMSRQTNWGSSAETSFASSVAVTWAFRLIAHKYPAYTFSTKAHSFLWGLSNLPFLFSNLHRGTVIENVNANMPKAQTTAAPRKKR